MNNNAHTNCDCCHRTPPLQYQSTDGEADASTQGRSNRTGAAATTTTARPASSTTAPGNSAAAQTASAQSADVIKRAALDPARSLNLGVQAGSRQGGLGLPGPGGGAGLGAAPGQGAPAGFRALASRSRTATGPEALGSELRNGVRLTASSASADAASSTPASAPTAQPNSSVAAANSSGAGLAGLEGAANVPVSGQATSQAALPATAAEVIALARGGEAPAQVQAQQVVVAQQATQQITPQTIGQPIVNTLAQSQVTVRSLTGTAAGGVQPGLQGSANAAQGRNAQNHVPTQLAFAKNPELEKKLKGLAHRKRKKGISGLFESSDDLGELLEELGPDGFIEAGQAYLEKTGPNEQFEGMLEKLSAEAKASAAEDQYARWTKELRSRRARV